jgi:hypothetical protein
MMLVRTRTNASAPPRRPESPSSLRVAFPRSRRSSPLPLALLLLRRAPPESSAVVRPHRRRVLVVPPLPVDLQPPPRQPGRCALEHTGPEETHSPVNDASLLLMRTGAGAGRTLLAMLEDRLFSLPTRRREAAKVVMVPVGILPGSGSPYTASHDRTSLRLPRAAGQREVGQTRERRRPYLAGNCITIGCLLCLPSMFSEKYKQKIK